MRNKIAALLLINIVLFLFFNTIDVHGLALPTDSPSQEDYNTYVENIEWSTIENEPQKSLFFCFDVNAEGQVIIGRKLDNHNKAVIVYDKEGHFLRGYTFRCAGTFKAVWSENGIMIYFHRGDIVISINTVGIITDIQKVTEENFSIFEKDRSIPYTITFAGGTCTAGNSIDILNLSGMYSQIYITYDNGVQACIYDASTEYLYIIFFIISACIICAIGTFWITKKARNKTGDGLREL